MSINQFLLVLQARWLTAFGVFFAVIMLAAGLSVLMPQMYTASATVVADTKPDPLTVAGYSSQTTTAYIATQVDIISSQRVAGRVVKVLKLDSVPQYIANWRESTGSRGDLADWISTKLLKQLVVTPSRDSSVIDISVTWTDPKSAAILANAFAHAYIDTNIELKVDTAKQYATWFDEQSKALRLDLEAKQKRLSDFQNESGIIATDSRLDIENTRLAELSSQLLGIQALRQDSQSRQRQAGGGYDSIPEVLQSPVIGALKADLGKAEAKLQDIATNVGKNHPDYRNTTAEIASLRARIEAESAKIAASLGSTTQVNLRREADIKAAVEAQKKRMLDLTHQHDEAAVLLNDVSTAQRNLDAVSQRLAQSSLESQTQQTNISLLTTAVEPLKRSSPKYFLNLLVAIFLGSILGAAAALFRELRDRRIRDPAELSQLLGIPTFARIPNIRPEGPPARSAHVLDGRVEPSAI